MSEDNRLASSQALAIIGSRSFSRDGFDPRRRLANATTQRGALSPALRVVLTAISVGFVLLATGCGKDGPHAKPASPEDIPPSVSVPPASVSLGLRQGQTRTSAKLDGFRIAKTPVTVAQYGACERAGACPEPSTGCSVDDGAAGAAVGRLESEAIACVGVAAATAYCAWVGGELPNGDQWLEAARGPRVRRYAWGDTVRSCADHAGIQTNPLTRTACPRSEAPRAVGLHVSAASPFGVEDVLILPGELLAAAASAFSPACSEPFKFCVASGAAPGAIDTFEALPAVEDPVSRTEYAFRCTWKGDSAQ